MLEIFEKLGYDLISKNKILNSYAVNRYSDEVLEKLVINTFDYFKSYGYKDSEIIHMTSACPTLFNYSNKTLDKRFDFLYKLGFSLSEISKMTIILPQLFTISDNYILEKYEFFLKLGYSKKSIHNMVVLVPSIFSNSVSSLISKRDFFKDLGFDYNRINKITQKVPGIYSQSVDSLRGKYNYLFRYHGREKCLNMILRRPDIMALSIENMESKRKVFLDFGYSDDEINYIIGFNPTIYTLSIKNILDKCNYFVSKGYSREDANRIILKVPSVFNYSKESLDEKIEILRLNGLDQEVLRRPSYLMQGIRLSYSRMSFLRDNDIVLDHKAFNYLVMSNKAFERRFGINNDEVLNRYSSK